MIYNRKILSFLSTHFFMKKLLLSLLTSGLVLILPSAGTAAPASVDATQAHPSIETLTERWQGNNVEGRFIEKKTIAGFPKPLVSSGNFSIDRDQGVRWETEKPFPNTLVFNGDGVRYIGKNAPTSVSAGDVPAVGHLADLIRGILAGDLKLLSNVFTLSVSGEPKTTVIAYPKEKHLSRAVREIVIVGRDSIESIRIAGPSGDVTELTLFDVTRR